VTTNILGAIGAPEGYVDPILVYVNALPVAHDRDVEQAVRDAAANFQRSATQRIRAVEESSTKAIADLDQRRATLEAQLAALETGTATAKSDVETQMDALTADFEKKLTAYDVNLVNQRASFDNLVTSHSETFAESQTERATEFDVALATAQQRLDAFELRVGQEVDERVAEIRRMEDESSKLVGAIGLAGTSERYGVEAVAQKQVADKLRNFTVGLALGAVAMAVFAVVHNPEDAHATAAKLGVSVVFGALAAYTARQSGRHRTREERARNLQLELTAFAPFIELLPEDQQEFERVLMTRKTFGNIAALPEADAEHNYGLGPLGPVRDRLKKKPDAAE